MSLIQDDLLVRAGHEDLPPDVGPDPAPDEALPQEPVERAGQSRFHLTHEDFVRAADMLTVELAVIRAVTEIEAAGRGFLSDGRPQILYEAHVFGRLTGHRHSMQDSRGKALSARSWDRSLYGASGAWQHDGRLAPAAKLDWGAAHKACSWGYFQILGSNHASVGYDTIASFVEAVHSGASAHLDMLVKFVRENKLDGALRRRDWAAFARGYNGPGYAQNKYDTKLAAAYQRWVNSTGTVTAPVTPVVRRGDRNEIVARLQRMLVNISGRALELRDDGVFGPVTESVVKEFQRAHGLRDDGVVGPLTWAALAEAAEAS